MGRKDVISVAPAGGLGARARFLFRNEDGVIDAPTWRFHAIWLVLLLGVLTAIWSALRPYAHHDLAKTAFLAPMTIIAFTYLIVDAFAVILIAISFVMLSMKRCRDRGLPTGLAGLVPLLAFFAVSLHLARAQTPDVITIWYVACLDAAVAAATLWTAVELGIRPTSRSRPSVAPDL